MATPPHDQASACRIVGWLAGCLIAVAPLAAQTAGHERLLGTIYQLGSHRTKVLYRWEFIHDEAKGVWRSWYRTPSGALDTEDEARWHGAELLSYRFTRHPEGETAEVVRDHGEWRFTRTLNGVTERRSEKDQGAFTTGPTIFRYVQMHWPELMAGRTLPVQFGILDRLRSLDFDLTWDHSPPAADADSVTIRMRATSALVRLFASPVYLRFSPDGRLIRGMIGRALPRQNVDGHWRSVDAELVIQRVVALAP